MDAKLLEKKGLQLESYTYEVEKGKIREFAISIGDEREEYVTGTKVPPTFPTVIDFWGGGSSTADLLNLDVKRVLHGEQAYEYVGIIKPGDRITVSTTIEDIYEKASMNFVVLKKEYRNQDDQLVLISRSTVIERQKER
ncbi:FAS1-like dehydratase domain-containing protein [Pradoshia sp.]